MDDRAAHPMKLDHGTAVTKRVSLRWDCLHMRDTGIPQTIATVSLYIICNYCLKKNTCQNLCIYNYIHVLTYALRRKNIGCFPVDVKAVRLRHWCGLP